MGKFPRNSRCPCGSGKKYKHCHGDPSPSSRLGPDELAILIQRQKARALELELQHGRGRPPISANINGYTLVGVGSELYWSKSWKTFPDFLMHYFKHVMGREWGEKYLARPRDQWHPIFLWYAMTCEYQRTMMVDGEISESPMIGAAAGIMWLTYSLYLLRHNAEIQNALLHRLRSSETHITFSAIYETQIAATMIWAGFDLEFENEQDGSTSHCEFTATSKRTGKKYSVEAKVRDPGGYSGGKNRVSRQFSRAIKKAARYQRIVCIDLNRKTPPGFTVDALESEVRDEMTRVQKNANNLQVRGTLAPPAYVMLTNFPFRHDLEGFAFPRSAMIEGFRIPGFKKGSQFSSLRALAEFREQHSDIFVLGRAYRDMKIPDTLDGQLASRAFGNFAEAPIKVGEKYMFDGVDGQPTVGEITQAFMMEDAMEATAVVRHADGSTHLYKVPITEDEMRVYRESPRTFFGIIEDKHELSDPVELYEWFLGIYKHSKREVLLAALGRRADDPSVPDTELAKELSERLARNVLSQANGSKAVTVSGALAV